MSAPRSSVPPHPHAERRLNSALRHALLMLALGGLVGAGMPATAFAAEAVSLDAAATRAYAIPAGPLGRTLASFAVGSGIALSFDPVLTEGLGSLALSGRFTAREAITRLLAGSGLQVVARTDGSYTLGRRPAGSSNAQGGVDTLAPVTVTAEADRSGTTEGTGSYTTPATAAATGLALSLRDTPQSVTVLTRQQIEDQNLLSLGQAMKSVTGVFSVSSDTDRTDLYSRGFYIDNYQYDGVPTTVTTDFFGASNNDPTLYDRIEVVRGSTGLLSGAGNPSASINLVRKHADSKVFAGAVSLGLGSWNQRRATVDLSTPLTEDGRVRARVIGMAEARDSYIDMYHGRKRVFYGVVDADLTPDTTLSVGVEYQANRPTGSTWGGLPLVFSDGSPARWDASKTVGTPWTNWDATNTIVFANLTHRFDNGWKLKANLAHRKSEQDARLLYLYGDMDRITGTGLRALTGHFEHAFRQNNVDLQLTGPFELLGRKHEVVVGMSNAQSRYVQAKHAPVGEVADSGNFYLWNGSFPEPAWGPLKVSEIDKTRQTGYYGAVRFSLADPLKLIVGGRQNSWRTSNSKATRRHEVFTPYAGLVYDINDTYSAYASYTDIFQPQNYRDATGAYLDPVTGKSYEIGIKGEHLGGKLNTSFALFRAQQDNVAQRDGGRLVPDSTNEAYRGAKGVLSKGFEMQVSGELASGWNLSAGIARTLAREANGDRVNTAMPSTLVNVFTTYRLPGQWQQLTVGGGVNWQNRTYYRFSVDDVAMRYTQKSLAVVSLMARYAFTPKLSLQVNVENLFNKKYYNNIDGQAYVGIPRNVVATLNYKF
ncbi:ferric-rhodotorulic acid/ferric-coprogen receptor FhuE [Variovorax sp. KBW07]|uniref:ferric-rhodotorulic acid/ferric-coprogen receptor FhuE n=1 Tax=Variovorax sp. KBW07 TaxID=2153358 RepID=UPI000F583F55|nr:ferric-rhodotorulic acid/ferric-coprogen receptor FhuE [Variovorax sp. KBW07]RQO63787.1 ferric-rhodotorulic acid/ferric-coprogen receptor FhuE [Variovorax sp. KBW07]